MKVPVLIVVADIYDYRFVHNRLQNLNVLQSENALSLWSTTLQILHRTDYLENRNHLFARLEEDHSRDNL